MQFLRLQPVCKELLYSTFHREDPSGIFMIGGFTLKITVVKVFVQWLLHMLSCWL